MVNTLSKRLSTPLAIAVIVIILLELPRFIIPSLRIDNPAVTQHITWDSPETEALWRQTCGDCHSNETRYPWYAYFPVAGWIVAKDVHEGRDALNISEDNFVDWDEMVEKIYLGTMPLSIYLSLHPDAKLTEEQRTALMNGIQATFR